MADTKHLDRKIRKGVKRAARKRLDAVWASVKPSDRRKMRKAEEKVGVREYLIRQKKEAAQNPGT